MLFRRFHKNYKGCTADTHNNESKPRQAPPVISHGRPWGYGKTVFNEMIAYILTCLSHFFSFFCCWSKHSDPVMLKFIFL